MLKKLNLTNNINELIASFQKRFGTKYSDILQKRLQNVNAELYQEPYANSVAYVDEHNGTIRLNELKDTGDLNRIIRHELIHKLDNVIEFEGRLASHFEFNQYDDYKLAQTYKEFITEWINASIDNSVTYIKNNDNGYIKANAERSSYTRGVNLIQGLSTLIGEENILDVYTGEKSFDTLIDEYNLKYGDGSFLRLSEAMCGVFRFKRNAYDIAINEILSAYRLKQNSKQDYDKSEIEAMHSEIQKLVDIMPIRLKGSDEIGIENAIEEIQNKYFELCNEKNISTKDFSKESISDEQKNILLDLMEAKEQECTRSKRIFGVDIPVDSSGDIRNNIYRIMSGISDIQKGIFEDVIKQNKYFVDIIKRTSKLPYNISNHEDLESYLNLYEYANTYFKTVMIQELDSGEKGTLDDYRNCRSFFNVLRDNSIRDNKSQEILGGVKDSAKVFNLFISTNVNLNESLLQQGDTSDDLVGSKEKMENLKVTDKDLIQLKQNPAVIY